MCGYSITWLEVKLVKNLIAENTQNNASLRDRSFYWQGEGVTVQVAQLFLVSLFMTQRF